MESCRELSEESSSLLEKREKDCCCPAGGWGNEGNICQLSFFHKVVNKVAWQNRGERWGSGVIKEGRKIANSFLWLKKLNCILD